MTDENKKVQQVIFAPGCFDDFEGTQEELDEFVKSIQTMLTSMTHEELEERSQAVDIEALLEDMTEEEAVKFLTDLGVDLSGIEGLEESDIPKRKLH